MNNNKYRWPNGTVRRLRRMEDKLDIILSDLNRINTKLYSLQSQINSRNEMETDLAIERLKMSAMSLKEFAEYEAKRISERYGTSRI